MTAPAEASSGPRRGSPAVLVLGLATGVALLLGCLLPFVTMMGQSSDGLLPNDSTAFTVLVVTLIGATVLGALGARNPVLAGVAGGAGLVSACFALFLVAAIAVFFVGGSFGPSPGPGFFALCGAAAGGAATFLASVAVGRRGGPNGVPGVLALCGAAAGVGATVGLMLPPPDSTMTFAERNLEIGNTFLQVAYLAFVGCFAVAAVVGFAMRGRTGVGVAIGAGLPLGWLVLATLLEVDKDGLQSEEGIPVVLREELHPVAPIATILLGLCIVAALVRSAAVGVGAVAPLPPQHPPPPPPPPVAGPTVAAFPPPVFAPPSVATIETPVRRTGVSPPAAPASPFLVLSDGRRIAVTRTVVIGRDPAPADTDGDVTRISIPDPARELSKTHLAIGRTDDEVWIEDRHSTNGVVVEEGVGGAVALPPGERCPLALGSRVVLGEISIVLEPAGATP